MKYKCLVLDHDDTVVRSTPTVHYPSFIEAMKELRPHVAPYTLEEFVALCFDPGFFELCFTVLGYTEDEMQRQQAIWRSYTAESIPPFYEGFVELITAFKNKGGLVCVVSHSESDRIIRDYKAVLGIEPDAVFGWDMEETQRKPHPYPLEEIMRRFNLEKEDLLMVDDLKPGLDMAKSCGVEFACAGWSHVVDGIRDFMRAQSDYYFEEVQELVDLVL